MRLDVLGTDVVSRAIEKSTQCSAQTGKSEASERLNFGDRTGRVEIDKIRKVFLKNRLRSGPGLSLRLPCIEFPPYHLGMVPGRKIFVGYFQGRISVFGGELKGPHSNLLSQRSL